ncbi:hypothetical protein BD410DRAFT_843624, partial [Rickenella mellea]
MTPPNEPGEDPVDHEEVDSESDDETKSTSTAMPDNVNDNVPEAPTPEHQTTRRELPTVPPPIRVDPNPLPNPFEELSARLEDHRSSIHGSSTSDLSFRESKALPARPLPFPPDNMPDFSAESPISSGASTPKFDPLEDGYIEAQETA